MDSWSGFRDHAVIFHHVSVPLNSQCLCPEAMPSLVRGSPRLSASFCVAVRGGEDGRQKNPSDEPKKAEIKHGAEEDEEKRGKQGERERERVNEEKAYYQKTDGPPIHSGPTGTWRDNSLHLRVTSAAERGGALKHDSVCVHFCLLTCKQKANLWHLWQGAILSSMGFFKRFPRSSPLKRLSKMDLEQQPADVFPS